MSNILNTLLYRNVWTKSRHLLTLSAIGAQNGCKRAINASSKKKDSHGSYDSHSSVPSFVPGFMDPQPKGPQTVREFADIESQKNWVSYGWDIGNREEDRFLNRWAFLLVITISTILVPYIMLYYPDYRLHDWSTREAYLELDRRERLGLPLVDKNLVDPNLLVLPSDEELGDTEIYI
ncbi:unnamed protein product [Medioppia subpectinata]|uniref:NADH dehydrogenase [ubiquinone] 1 beta subcomplex subunit 11, mitochondrial n=1 Tax=Medioppia subpectinata TaxID=1979941 RepID=A0A7R9L8D0_9ACAR|nr:unnamed protein product [Medioppia subpectinata]CAG2116381.1 unnamed protein product [Medioppia subpectinata]